MAASTWVVEVRCLPRSLPPASVSTELHQRVQEHFFLSSRKQALTKFREHREIKARIGQFQAEARTSSQCACAWLRPPDDPYNSPCIASPGARRSAKVARPPDLPADIMPQIAHPYRPCLIRLSIASIGSPWEKAHVRHGRLLREWREWLGAVMTSACSFFLALLCSLHSLSAILPLSSSTFTSFRQQGQKMNRTLFLCSACKS